MEEIGPAGPTFPEIDLSATLSGPFAQSSAVTCEIKINKLVVATNVNTVGNCSTTFALKNFSALASASPSPSPAAVPSPTKAAPVTRDPACRYASDAEVSGVVSAHLGGAQTVLFTNGMYGGCGYHFTNEITANDVVITYWRGTVARNEGTSVAGLGGKAKWDSRTLSVQRSGGVVTIEVRLPGEDSQDKDIGIELYKLIRGRIK